VRGKKDGEKGRGGGLSEGIIQRALSLRRESCKMKQKKSRKEDEGPKKTSGGAPANQYRFRKQEEKEGVGKKGE